MYKHAMVAYHGCMLSDKALNQAIMSARQCASKVSLLYVLAPHRLMLDPGTARSRQEEHIGMLRRRANQMLNRAHKRLKAAKIQGTVALEEGLFPYQRIAESAKRLKCDLILMASHGRQGFEARKIGS